MTFKSVVLVFAIFAILNFTHATTIASSSKQYSISDEISNTIYFSLKSYQTLFDANENFVFSPFSMRVAYNTLFQIAFGRAEFKIKPILFENSSILIKDSVLIRQHENFRTITDSPNVKMANKLYYENSEGLRLSDGIIAASIYFQSEYEQVDFTKQKVTKAVINNWVENRTFGNIQNFVDSSIVTPATSLLFVNTVFFKARWLNMFEWNDQVADEFNSIDGTTKTIDFIAVQSRYKFAFLNQFKVDVLELPYERNSGLALWILLPYRDSSIIQLKSLLDRSLFTTIKSSFVRRYRSIKFPLFQIETELDGTTIAPEVFAYPNFQVFNNLISAVDKIQQKVKIVVDLEGTEAVAATALSAASTSTMVGPKSKECIANRPFIYTVLNRLTLQPIFIGHFSIA